MNRYIVNRDRETVEPPAGDSSASARKRREGRHQLDERREAIIGHAQELFLSEGLETASMTRIAEHAGITTVTLYRYFPDRHPIAFEVAARMIDRIAAVAAEREHSDSATVAARFRAICLAMVDEFDQLRNAYRYIGLFDHLYAQSYPSQELAAWYKGRLSDAFARFLDAGVARETEQGLHARRITLLNTIMSFLEKMAARGELMAQEQEAPLPAQLRVFRSFVETLTERELA